MWDVEDVAKLVKGEGQQVFTYLRDASEPSQENRTEDFKLNRAPCEGVSEDNQVVVAFMLSFRCPVTRRGAKGEGDVMCEVNISILNKRHSTTVLPASQGNAEGRNNSITLQPFWDVA